MKVFVGDQAESMYCFESFPINSIGVFFLENEWIYWFKNTFSFDTGTATNEKEAFAKAKMNIQKQ